MPAIPIQNQQDIDDLLTRREMRLLATLQGRVGYSRFKERALRIADFDGRHIGRELRWLCNLGLLEIERDARGKWTSLIPTPYAAHQLPTHTPNGWRQFILTGSPTHLYGPLLNGALGLGLDADWQAQPGDPRLVPPRIRILARTEEDFLKLLEQLEDTQKPAYQTSIAAESFAEWAGDIVGWRTTLGWWECQQLNAEKYYLPTTFDMRQVDPAVATGTFKLGLVGFEFDQDTKLHVLGHYNNIDMCQRRAFVGDPSWGKWEAQHSGYNFFRETARIGPGPIQIPYYRGELVLPDGLNLPYMLARAVVLCSGFVPHASEAHPAWCEIPAPGRPIFNVNEPYKGLCWVYSQVPPSIAETVLAKVGAVPTDWL